MISKWKKPILAVTLCLFITLALTGTALAQVADVKGHWAEEQITNWVNLELILGYSDGTFKPNNSITRAEVIALVNRSYDLEGMVKTNFSDVSSNDWFAEDVAKAIAAGYITGYTDGTVKPNNPISRQEVATILARLQNLGVVAAEDALGNFQDADQVPEWSQGYIVAVTTEGYMGGYPDGTFRPDAPITRAETAVTLDRAQGISENITAYDKAGTYGSDTGVTTIDKNVIIGAAGVTLQNVDIKGDLLLAEAIGEGDVELINVTVSGDTTVKGGGSNSIVLVDCTLPNITVDKDGVRVVASGSTSVKIITLDSGAILVEVSLKGEGFENVIISEEVARGANIVLSGDFAEITVEEGVSKVDLEIAEGATVKTLTLNGTANLFGDGNVDTLNVNANGSTVDMKNEPKNIKLAEGVTVEVSDSVVKKEKSTGGSSGGSGSSTPTKYDVNFTVLDMDYNPINEAMISINNDTVVTDVYGKRTIKLANDIYPYTVRAVDYKNKEGTVTVNGASVSETVYMVKDTEEVSAISVEGDALAGSILTAKTTPVNATGNYQWLKASATDGEYTKIDGATAKTYTLTNEDVGSYIKVTIKGTGSYKGTVTSDPSGEVEQPAKSTYKFTYEIPEGDVVAGVSVKLPVTTGYDILGDKGYDSVLIKFKGKSTDGDAEVTFKITEHGTGTEYTFVGSGQWGSPGGWELEADFSSENTWTLIFHEAGDYTISFWLEELDDEGNTISVIYEASEEVTVRDKEHSEYGFLIGEEHQAITVPEVDELITTAANSVPVSADQNETLEPGVVTDNALEALATALNSDYTKDVLASRLVKVILEATDIKELDYDKVRILPLEIEKTHGEGNDSTLQVWMYASAQDKAWHNIVETGWGSKGTGFKLDSDENSPMKAYVFGTSPGVYEIKFKAVDTSEDNEPLIAEGTAEVIVRAAGVNVGRLAENYYDAGDTLEFTISGLEPNDDVKVGMPIFVGHGGGWPWASGEHVLTTGMRNDEEGDLYWFGKTDEYGELLVSGEVESDLPSGELWITLPDYGYYLNNGFPLQDENGNPVRVGAPSA